MNLVLFSKCLYKGNIKHDFYQMMLAKSPNKIKHKLRLLYFLSAVNKHMEGKLWCFLHDQYRLDEEIQAFYQANQDKCNQEVIALLAHPTTVILDAPTFLCRPFLPAQITDIIGYDIDFTKKRIIPNEMSEAVLTKKIKHSEITVDTVIDKEASMLTKYAKQAWIAAKIGLVNYKEYGLHDYWKKQGLRLLILLLYSCMITFFTFLCATFPFNARLFISYFFDFKVLLLNLFPVLMLMLFLYALTRRIWLSALLTEIPFFVLAFANFMKLKFRDYPVVFSDLTLLSEATIMAGKYDITPTLWHIAFIVGSIILICILFKIKPLRYHLPALRGICAGVILVVSVFVITDTMMNDSIYDTAGDESKLRTKWTESQQLQRRGLIYPFIHSYKNAFESEPEGYDEALAQATLSAYSSSNIPEDKKINIVAIMLESYNDFSKFDLTFSQDIYAPLHQIEAEGYHGNLISNVFGGGTVNTERSFLTGYFHHPLYLRKTNSYVQYFNEQGYQTVALHPCYGSFYNRRNVNEYLGFQEFYNLENRYTQIGYDDVFFPDILDEYQRQIQSGKPYFNFSLNYQGHGPYPTEKRADIPNYLITDRAVDEGVLNGINYYFNGINNTNQHIQELHDAFQESDQPTVMVLFGDHNPVFGSGSDGYEMIGINMDVGTEEGFLNYYTTPYVFWANDAAKELYQGELPTGEGATISPNFLMNELFHYLGWEGNAYMKYTDDLAKELPVIHSSWKLSNHVWTQEISEEQQKLLNIFQMVEYYYVYNIK